MRVRIAGSEYVLRGPGSAAELQALAAELDRRLRAVIDANPRLALHQAVVLCALEILDELDRLRRQQEAAGVRRREAADARGSAGAEGGSRAEPAAAGDRRSGRSRR